MEGQEEEGPPESWDRLEVVCRCRVWEALSDSPGVPCTALGDLP